MFVFFFFFFFLIPLFSIVAEPYVRDSLCYKSVLYCENVRD